MSTYNTTGAIPPRPEETGSLAQDKMTSTKVAQRSDIPELKLFIDENAQYWVGRVEPGMTHQNGEPYLIDGPFLSMEEGLGILFSKTSEDS